MYIWKFEQLENGLQFENRRIEPVFHSNASRYQKQIIPFEAEIKNFYDAINYRSTNNCIRRDSYSDRVIVVQHIMRLKNVIIASLNFKIKLLP